jgi:Na+/melibiose symporter-like transporter
MEWKSKGRGLVLKTRDGLRSYFDRDHVVGPLRRLQGLSIAADTFTTIALAGSLFFSISPQEAKSKVALYLALTVAPFVIVAPLLAPALDRGSRFRRGAIIVSAAGRVVAVVLMSFNFQSVFLFPEALLALVSSKLYMITKAALVPDLLGYDSSDHDNIRGRPTKGPTSILVSTNASLSLLGAVVGVLVGGVAGVILKTPHLGSAWVFRVEVIPLVIMIFEVRHLRPRPPEPTHPHSTANNDHSIIFSDLDPVEEYERAQLSSPTHDLTDQETNAKRDETGAGRSQVRGGYSISLVASSAVAVLRGGVGFFTFLLAFELKRQHSPTYVYGLALLASAAGAGLATVITPRVRRIITEQQILIFALIIEAIAAVGAAYLGTIWAQVILAGLIGLVAAGGKLAFDAIVQHSVASHHQGRTFARNEMRFQFSWVIGALIPTLVALPLVTGDIVIGASAIVASFSFTAGRSALRSRDEEDGQVNPIT